MLTKSPGYLGLDWPGYGREEHPRGARQGEGQGPVFLGGFIMVYHLKCGFRVFLVGRDSIFETKLRVGFRAVAFKTL